VREPNAPRLVIQQGAEDHYRRGEWLLGTRSVGRLDAYHDRLIKARAQGKDCQAPHKQAKWRPIGPWNIGGRATCLAVPPDRPEWIYLGSAGGGVWLSKDRGKHWRSAWPDDFEQNIGSLAIDPQHPNVIYCGTGEANGSADSYPGTGVYRSTDRGKTWTQIASPGQHGVSTRIGCVAVDPFDSGHVCIAGFVKAKSEAAMLVTRDDGSTWNKAAFTRPNERCHCIVFHPRNRGVIFATIQSPTDAAVSRSGIWRSTDGGVNWRRRTKGLPGPELFRRLSLAIAPSQPDTIYALASTRIGSGDRVLGIYRSDDGGDVWRKTSEEEFFGEDQMSYSNCIAVHPEDPDFVIFGGLDLHLSRDGGSNWTRVTRWNRKRGHPEYAHADHHALVMPLRSRGYIYDANDGGLDVSRDGERWVNRSAGLEITMFYDVDVACTNEHHYGGGTQDNGTVITKTGRPNDFHTILGADGGWMVYDPMDCYRIVASEQEMRLYRLRDGRKRVAIFRQIDDQELSDVWMSYIALDPNNPRVAYTGSIRVWKSINGGFSWNPCSDWLDGSVISSIDVGTKSNRLYVGTRRGGFFRSDDGGVTWSRNLGRGQLPRCDITRIESHPRNQDLVFITLGQTKAETRISHVWKSEHKGDSWTDVDRGRLPQIKHTALAFRTDKPDYLYVANHVGVFATRDLGKTWLNITANLPNAMPVDLVYHERSKTLTVATYGRSLWRLQLR
jgi:photosystem II stability/assembly factor-like uncharacterized protein